MKRRRRPNKKAILVTVWLPKHWLPLIDQIIGEADSDRSKFIRNLIKRRLGQRGVGA